MNGIFKFGEDVEGYNIPVLNEREIRAAAGILFLLLFIAMREAGSGSFYMIKYLIVVFLSDLLVRVFVSPRYSPFLILGRMIVRNQNPEYVGAAQKKFAWGIGILFSSTVFFMMVVFNTYSPISGLACFFCLIFLFFESAFGICLGCKFYSLFYRKKAQYCPGEICEVKNRQEIQRVALSQILAMAVFILLVIGTGYVFHNAFSEQPYDLFGIDTAALKETE